MFAVLSRVDDDYTERVCLCDSEARAYEIAHQTAVKEGTACRVIRVKGPFSRRRDRDGFSPGGGTALAGGV